MKWHSIENFAKWIMLREHLDNYYFEVYKYIKDLTGGFKPDEVLLFKESFNTATKDFEEAIECFQGNMLDADYLPSDLCYGGRNEVLELLNKKVACKFEQPQPEPKQKYFDKAIESGFIEKTDNGYKWVFGGKASLGYFLTKIYGISERIPYKNIEKLFNVTRLDRAVSQLNEAKKPQKWRIEIDKLIESLD